MTEKQKIFANEYLVDLNATRAYRVAYPSVKKDETARTNGSRLLTNANVAAYIAERMKERQERTEITQDRVIEELAAIALARMDNYAEIKNNRVLIKDSAEFTEMQARAIGGIKQGKFGIEVKLNDKLKALELLGRHLGMFKDKLEVSGLEEEKKKLGDILEQLRGDE